MDKNREKHKMSRNNAYGLRVETDLPYEQEVERRKGALQVEHELGLLLPCNVVVHEHGAGAVVSAPDPEVMFGVVDNRTLRDIARGVTRKPRKGSTAMSRLAW